MELPWLENLDGRFPPVHRALEEPNGLLCAGGTLSPPTLLEAYRHGIFPWFEDDQPVLWWSPDPRMILRVEDFTPSRSLRKTLKRETFEFKLDAQFKQVMRCCAAPRGHENGTWITPDMLAAYAQLHEMGYAHSMEAYRDGELVGGLYGVAIGRQFFGESMFSRADNASKAALTVLIAQLKRWAFEIIDCQVTNPHLVSLGAEEISRAAFVRQITQACAAPSNPGIWCLDDDLRSGSGALEELSAENPSACEPMLPSSAK